MRGRSLQRRASLALLLGLGIAAVPLATPAQADCIEFTMYITWNGTDPTGQPTTPVHNGCVTDLGGTGGLTIDKGSGGASLPGTPSGYYLYLKVPNPV